MTEIMLGAAIALATMFVSIWLFETLARLTASTSAGRADGASRTGLIDVAPRQWRSLLAATLLALGLPALVSQSRQAATVSHADALPSSEGSAAGEAGMAPIYDQLRTFAEQGGRSPMPLDQSPIPADATGLPGVEAMIASLAARLETKPDDVAGWRMLGWSYFHTDRYPESVVAYEQALKLAPDDAGLLAALEEARRAAGSGENSNAAGGKGPSAADIAAAGEMPEQDRQAMIAGMVDGLASRLALSPRDEDGWIKLMRSRIVLGQPDAAAKDLATARLAFASETAVLDRLAKAARSLGVPGAQ